MGPLNKKGHRDGVLNRLSAISFHLLFRTVPIFIGEYRTELIRANLLRI
ncbi:MAG: hypothetical protein JWN28_378 [Candidatus Saccharibacteria bacterium]|nr:hypothetical protein [Candidatus Saccharibacteria bacterium]